MANKIFVAVENSSLFDIALNTYGSLDYIGKLIQDNPENGLNLYPLAGTQFVWDDSLQISQTNAIVGGSGMFVGQKYATRPTDEPQANFAPQNILPPTINGAISVGSTLTAISGAWSGLPTPTLTYQWQSSTDGGVTWSDIVGQTASTYVLISGDELKEIRVNQIATNSLGTAQRASAYVQPYASGGSTSIPPSLATAPTSFVAGGGAPVIGAYLILSPGAWNGDGPIAFTYEWKIGATVVGTAQVYQIQASDFGQTIVGKVIATNTFGTDNSATTGITAVQLPINTVLPVIGTGSDVGTTLSVTSNGTWTGNATITYTYQWLSNSLPISGATNSTYTLVLADMGQSITCRVKGSNTYGDALAVSNAITCTKAPSITTAPVPYGSTKVGGVLSVFDGVWSAFPAPTFTYVWQFSADNGATWNNYSPSQTGSTYTVTNADLGDLIRCRVTATNSSGSATADSQTIQILNEYTPTAPSVAVNPQINIITTQIPGQYLEVTDGVWNGDAPITFAYQWRKNGTIISGATGSTYLIVSGDYTASITCTVTATNAVGATSYTTTGVTIQQPPIQTAGASISGTYATGNTITASIGTWTGSATITYAFQWYRSGAVITGATSSTYTLVTADEDTTLSVIITASNAWGSVATNAVGNQYIYTSEYQAVLTFATAQGYTLPSTAQRIQHNKLVIDMKALGDWTIMDRIYQFKNVGSQNFALINWRNPTVGTLLVLNNTPTWSDTLGFTGGGTAFLDTQFNPATAGGNYTQNNAGRYAYVTARPAEGTTYQIDGNSVTNDNGSVMAVTSTANRINQGTTSGTSTNTRTIGFHAITRTSSTVSSRANDIVQAMTITSSAMTSANQLLFRSGGTYSAISIGFYSIGGAIPDADIPSFRAVLNKYFAV